MSYTTCTTCITYAEGRQSVLAQALADQCAATDETSQEILDRYMGGVHDRHLSGLSLSVTA